MLPQSTQLLTEKSHRKRQPVASSDISHAFSSQRNNSFHHGFLTKTLGLVSGAVLAAGTFFGAFGVAPHAAEALNFSNSSGSTAAVSPGSNSWYATSFTIDTGYYLDELVIKSALSDDNGPNNILSASIYTNASDVPSSSPLTSLSGIFPVTSQSLAGQVNLTPSVKIGSGTYWLVVQGDGTTNNTSLRILNSPVSSGSGGSVNKVLARYWDSSDPVNGTNFAWDNSNTSDAIELAFTVSVPFEFSPVGGVAILATGYGVHQLIKRRRAAAKTEAESTEKTPV
jgi:hypothetical protein